MSNSSSTIDYRINEINIGINSYADEEFVNVKIGASKHLNIEPSKVRLLEHAYQIEYENTGAPIVQGTRQGIITKVLGPTDTKGQRHKATISSGGKSITKDFHAYNNKQVAQMLADIMGWGTVVIGAAIDTQGSTAWICEPEG